LLKLCSENVQRSDWTNDMLFLPPPSLAIFCSIITDQSHQSFSLFSNFCVSAIVCLLVQNSASSCDGSLRATWKHSERETDEETRVTRNFANAIVKFFNSNGILHLARRYRDRYLLVYFRNGFHRRFDFINSGESPDLRERKKIGNLFALLYSILSTK